MNHHHPDQCPLCGGSKKRGVTTFSADFGLGVVVIRQVPAIICTQCGADWIDDKTAARIEEIIKDARDKQSQVEVLAFN